MKKPIILFIILFNCSALFSAELYTVQENDSLSEIASRYGVSAYRIGYWNNIEDLNRINKGQVLFVEEPIIEDVYQEKVEPLKKQLEKVTEELKQLELEQEQQQDNAQGSFLSLLLAFLILVAAVVAFIVYKWKYRKIKIPETMDHNSLLAPIYEQLTDLKKQQKQQFKSMIEKTGKFPDIDKLEKNVINAFNSNSPSIDLSEIIGEIQQLKNQSITTKTEQVDFTEELTTKITEMPEKIDRILFDYQQQVATKNIESQFLLEQWQHCKQDLIDFGFTEINQDLETLSQIFINPIKKENQFKRNDCYALSQTLAGLEEILYWHHWLVLPIDEKFINTLASLLELSKLIALQQHYYIHKYPIDSNINPRYHFDKQFKKIIHLSNDLDLLELVSANMLDLLLLLNEIKVKDKEKDKMIQALFKSEAPIQYQNSIEIQARRVNRRRIYGFNHLSIFSIDHQKSETNIEVEQY